MENQSSSTDPQIIAIVIYITFIGWIIGLIAAVQKETKPVPLIGDLMQCLELNDPDGVKSEYPRVKPGLNKKRKNMVPGT
jgi:hypothetical protein